MQPTINNNPIALDSIHSIRTKHDGTVSLDDAPSIPTDVQSIFAVISFVDPICVRITYIADSDTYSPYEITTEDLRNTRDASKALKILKWTLRRKFLRADFVEMSVKEINVNDNAEISKFFDIPDFLAALVQEINNAQED